jgi:hypothetical protein
MFVLSMFYAKLVNSELIKPVLKTASRVASQVGQFLMGSEIAMRIVCQQSAHGLIA